MAQEEKIMNKSSLTSDKMRNMKIVPLLINMSIPAMISMFVLALYNIVDSIFVAQFDQRALDALSIAFPMQQLIVAFAVGIGVGTNAYVSRKLGQKKYEEASLVAQTGLFMALVTAAVFVVIGLTLSRPFISAFTDDPVTIEYGTTYLTVVTCFSAGSFIDIICSRTLQATGNMRIPMITQLVGAIVNIVFDPIFIFACGWGVLGAAIATVLGQFCAMAIGLLVFRFKKQDVSIFFTKSFRLRAPFIKGILKIAVPTMVMNAVAAFVTTILNLILKAYESAITVLGVYFKLQSFAFMPVFGLTQGALPIMSYNYGSKNYKRFMDAFKWSFIFAAAIMLFCTIIFMAIPGLLMKLFNAEGALLSTGIIALRAISISFVFAAFNIVCTSMVQSLRYGTLSMIMSLLRQVVLLIPLAVIFSMTVGVNGVWFSFPISEVIVTIAFALSLRPILKKKFPKTSPLLVTETGISAEEINLSEETTLSEENPEELNAELFKSEQDQTPDEGRE